MESQSEFNPESMDIKTDTEFAETPEMIEIKEKILKAGPESQEFTELYTAYQIAGEKVVDTKRTPEGIIFLMVKSADIMSQLGLIDDAIAAYEEAVYVAESEGLNDYVDKIKIRIDTIKGLSERN